ncbi:MAG TPA: hypothetical protein VFV08_07895, partial [Puia sp.]|nr:hypothetical protein [Puia sp.]
YLPKIKGLLTTVDNNIDKLNHGDALRTNNAKQMLFSSQSAAFANAFLISGKCATDIRKDGANSARNKLNSEKGVYDVSCSHSK